MKKSSCVKCILCFIALLSFLGSLGAEEDFYYDGIESYSKSCILVSLGSQCWTAQALRAAGLRDIAYPFDWLDSNHHDGFIRMLDENFLHFVNKECFHGGEYTKYGRQALVHGQYGIIFSHDWPVENVPHEPYDAELHMRGIEQKYTRRIERFRNLNGYDGKVFFIRTLSIDPDKIEYPGWNTQKALELQASLEKLFPNLNFTLVIVSCSDPNIPEIDAIDNIMEFKIQNLTNLDEYTVMFHTLLHLSSDQ